MKRGSLHVTLKTFDLMKTCLTREGNEPSEIVKLISSDHLLVFIIRFKGGWGAERS